MISSDKLKLAPNPPSPEPEPEAATRNACKLCAPLGAALVFKGVKGCLPFLHGSQGCATYIRRYMISHFREPVDIASSSFSEDDAIFGGSRNFKAGLENVTSQYRPDVIGVATTCLAETIGEHMIGMIKAYQDEKPADSPPLIHVSTPAYVGSHAEGYRAAVTAVLSSLVEGTSPVNGSDSNRDKKSTRAVNILPTMMSCADLRALRSLSTAFGLDPTILPDYSDTLEGSAWGEYHRMPPGGVELDAIRRMGGAAATIEIGRETARQSDTGARFLESQGVKRYSVPWPLGVRASDTFFEVLEELSETPMPDWLKAERGRLVDAYIDAHKYIAERRVCIYGEPDLVLGLVGFMSEIGMRPVLAATGSKVKGWRKLVLSELQPETDSSELEALDGADHGQIASRARVLKPEILVGSSKGYPLSRELGAPLLQVGFPVHDRFGAQRDLTVGYSGTQALFDRTVNTILSVRQDDSVTGYSYL